MNSLLKEMESEYIKSLNDLNDFAKINQILNFKTDKV